MAKNKRVVRYRAPINIDIGIVVFGIIFLYVAVYVLKFYSQERVTYYEVVNGTVADDSSHSYTAIALRNEKVSFADESGSFFSDPCDHGTQKNIHMVHFHRMLQRVQN